jgi:hypothetical protein
MNRTVTGWGEVGGGGKEIKKRKGERRRKEGE